MSSLYQRRDFLKTALGAAGYLAAAPFLARAQESASAKPPLRVGLVGCGGRGLGAVRNALDADESVVIWSLADAFSERLDFSTNLLREQYGARMQAEPSRCFAGLDAYQKLIDSGVDVVLLCSPPVFRPDHILAAVIAGKHMYVEKPVAVDVPGAMSVLESARMAATRNLVILDGFCWRYDAANLEMHQKLKDGELGPVRSFNGIYNAVPPKSPLSADSRPPGETDVSWALRNWTAWNWLSGGELVEQAIHTVDGMMWSMGENVPLAAFGTGGRAQRRDDGDVWDHYDIYYEYPDGVLGHVSCRQWVGSHSLVQDRTFCEKGIMIGPGKPYIQAEKRWRYRGEKTNMYLNTHRVFYEHVRKGHPLQTLEHAATVTLVGILGREAAQTGQRITWEQIQRNTTRLAPQHLTMDSALPKATVPVPG